MYVFFTRLSKAVRFVKQPGASSDSGDLDAPRLLRGKGYGMLVPARPLLHKERWREELRRRFRSGELLSFLRKDILMAIYTYRDSYYSGRQMDLKVVQRGQKG